jgi:hypothetical protein
MPLQATSGAASYDAFGGGVAAVPNYIEDVFSTYLYTGNGATQTITNGIDLSTKGGLVWIKSRSSGNNHRLVDSARGNYNTLSTNNTTAQYDASPVGPALTSTGFTVGNWTEINDSGLNYVSWTFREQAKFFDVVTYTGNGSSSQVISHALGSVPGCVIIKRTNSTSDWFVYHRGHEYAPSEGLALNLTASSSSTYRALLDVPTSTTFSAYIANTNTSGATYVAYVFAHNAGGFGLTGTDNVISCGSYTGTGGAGNTITLGYEPQFLMVKRYDSTGSWNIIDNMRGFTADTADQALYPNLTNAETALTSSLGPTATGFVTGTNLPLNASGGAYIYIAIRRGPMKVPTDGTKVFNPVTRTNANAVVGTLQASDMGWFKDRATTANWFVADRLRGIMSYYNPTLYTNVTDAEATPTTGDTVTAQSATTSGNGNIYFGGAGATTDQPLGYSFKRAPGFFDEVCYTGTGANTTVAHNLAAVPELMIVKSRTVGGIRNWAVYSSALGATKFLLLNLTNAVGTNTYWNNTTPTASVFSLDGSTLVNNTAENYVAYLFATCPGVSKVGSYTGTGTTQTINCGFTAGSRFVMIKRTDSTGDWYVWDSARGIVSGNDPYLLLNSTAAEVTSTDYVDTASTGFEISSTAPAAINASGGTFIFLAIA